MNRFLRRGALACALAFATVPELMPIVAYAQASAAVRSAGDRHRVVTVPYGTGSPPARPASRRSSSPS